MTFFRKIRSALWRLGNFSRSYAYILFFNVFQSGVKIDRSVFIDFGVRVSSTDGGEIVIAANASIGRFSRIVAKAGKISIGENVFIGDGCILVSQSEIEIGSDTLLGEYVVIRDQDHSYERRPIRSAGFCMAPVKIGVDCWIGAKATILRGSVVSDGAIVGAHALVRGYVPPYSLVGGSPAKVLKMLRGS